MDFLYVFVIIVQLEVFEIKDLYGLKLLFFSRGYSWEFIFMIIFVNIEFFCFKMMVINYIYLVVVLEFLLWVYIRVC